MTVGATGARAARRGGLVALTLLAGSALAGCGASESSGGASVATTTILGSVLGDIAECAGGDATTLMPVGVDPHDFAPSSAQVAEMVEAPLVVANGLGLEAGLEDSLESAREDGATIMEVAPLVNPIPFGESEHADEEGEHADEHAHSEEEGEHSEEEGEDAHEHGSLDPHFWHDVARMATAAELMGAELADELGDEAYRACGQEVHDELEQVDAQVREILAEVPEANRVLVTDHDAFGYLAEAYDYRIAGVGIPGGSTLAEPSSEELADLVAVIQEENVQAIFTNSADSSALAEAVAAEVGGDVTVAELYVGSVGPEGSGADTYAGMVLTNARTIADALA